MTILPTNLDPTQDEFSVERRRLLQLMAASAALAAAGCSGPPPEVIVPFARMPEYALPGKPLFYATSLWLRGYGMGVLVQTNDGRPTKVEGNPLHPASLGATDVFAQAAVLQLWDPARSQALLHDGKLATWLEFIGTMEAQLSELDRRQGEGLSILTGSICSPTLQSQIEELRGRYSRASWHQYEPLHRDQELLGSRLAFGRALDTRYYLDRARVLLTLDADFLSCAPYSVRYARDLMHQRNPEHGRMSRLYAVESSPGLIGAKADHRLALAPDEIQEFLAHLAQALNLAPRATAASPAPWFEDAVLEDFKANPGACLILPGTGLAPELHALVHVLNHRLGGLGQTFDHVDSVAYQPIPNLESIRALTQSMAAGQVQMLVVLDGNPCYDAPVDLDFATHLGRVPHSIHLAAYVDETSTRCSWHIPRAHEFEHWGDARAYDGTASIIQPVIAPLYGGRCAHELLNVLLRRPSVTAHETVRAHWQRTFGAPDAEERWLTALRDGVIAGTASPALSVAPPSLSAPMPATEKSRFLANFVADQSVLDGRFANNAWLQEIPRTLSKLTWDNAAYLSVRTAAMLGVKSGDEIEIRGLAQAIKAGVWVLPTHADNCVTLPLGYGRTSGCPVGSGVGFDAYRLRTLHAPWHVAVRVRSTGKARSLVSTQHHARMEGRDLVRTGSMQAYAQNPSFATAKQTDRIPDHTLYPDYPSGGYQWGMVIDLNACIGCNACTIACQAENNIPVVGKEQVQRGREMHWIRIDRYFQEDRGQTDTYFQPVPCMQCERAPCEVVCPVEASIHDSQGLNLQVYNRCVGTRFCSNNCPYKVRRFNFLQYSQQFEEAYKALHNPDVTVRQRGVMEKCTYCVQRIERGRIDAEQLGRPLRDGEIVTACQAVCPTKAITFGNINDHDSEVAKAKSSPRNYALLAELNTRPRTTYLAQVTNRKPNLEAAPLAAGKARIDEE